MDFYLFVFLFVIFISFGTMITIRVVDKTLNSRKLLSMLQRLVLTSSFFFCFFFFLNIKKKFRYRTEIISRNLNLPYVLHNLEYILQRIRVKSMRPVSSFQPNIIGHESIIELDIQYTHSISYMYPQMQKYTRKWNLLLLLLFLFLSFFYSCILFFFLFFFIDFLST